MAKNKKKKLIYLILIIIIIVFSIFIIRYYRYKNAKIIIDYNNLETPFLSDVKISDFINKMNGKLIKDKKINTTKVGKQKIKYEYINEDNIKLKQEFTINIIDNKPPLVMMRNNYTYKVGSKLNLLDKVFCGDNYDKKITKTILGNYSMDEVGTYDLVFKATDKSGNITKKKFKLNIVDKLPHYKYIPSTDKTDFNDIIKEYKNDKTEVGIDVSKWQGDIDFKKLKDSGVEFVIIRLGTSKGLGKERVVDKTFEQNMTRAKEVGMPVGVYFYSYANNKKEALKDAKFVLDTLKKRKLELPVVFDWENWQFYNEFSLSFYELSMMAKSFLDVVEKSGYKGMLYSSKVYLENVWLDLGYPVWLAHYTDKTNYTGEYTFWQLCNNGHIDGINGDVDIDLKIKR